MRMSPRLKAPLWQRDILIAPAQAPKVARLKQARLGGSGRAWNLSLTLFLVR